MTDPATERDHVDVSVILLTYNHEPYIAQAIESVLAQTTTANVEILISEDHSPDGTRAIVLDYARRYPDRIRVFLSERNLNTNEVYVRAYREARGEFVAYLDGDDYWKPEKLERQLEHMRTNPGASLCYHDVEVIREGGDTSHRVYGYGPYQDFEELLRGNPIASASMLFRRSMLGDLPSWFDDAAYGDWPLAILLADRGDVAYVDEPLSSYREHDGGMYSGSTYLQRREWDLENALDLAGHFGKRHRRATRMAVGTARFHVAHGHVIEGRRWPAIVQLVRSLAVCPHHPKLTAWLRMSTLFRVALPGAHRLARATRDRLRREPSA